MAKLAASGRRNLVLTLFLLALTSACVHPQPAAATGATLYVSPAGDDSGAGTPESPLRTIGRALQLAAPGATIEVAAGQYPPFRTNRLFAEPVTIHGQGGGSSVVQADTELQSEGAIEFWGAAGVVVEGMTVRGGRVLVTDERNHTLQRGSTDIALREDELVGEEGLGAGVTIRSGSQRIAIERCFIHDMLSGITGPNYRIISGVDNGLPLVEGVTIRDNRIERLKEDALQFADWNDVVIEGNVMRGAMHDPPPAPQYHNDLIQFTGYSSHVRIAGNYLAESAQEIFIQPAFGPIEDVVVENNLLWNSRAYAVQSQAVPRLRFVYNTLWDSSYGMTIRSGPHEEPAATDGVVVGNIVEKLAYPAGTREEYNLVGVPQRAAGYGPHDLLGVDPGFADPETGDLGLRDDSVAIAAGISSFAPETDLLGRRRAVPPSLGAYEWALAVPPGPAEPEPEGPEGETQQPGPEPGPSPGGAAAPEVHGAPLNGGAASGSPTGDEESASPPRPGRYPVRLVLRIGNRALVASTVLDGPAFCREGCSVTATGTVALAGGGGRRGSALLKPQRRSLDALLRHGLRLAPRRRVALAPDALSRAVARLRLRFAADGRRGAATLRVPFGHVATATRPVANPPAP